MAKTLIIEFEKGGCFEATLLEDKAPKTCSMIWECLPISSTCIHGRAPGRPGKEIAVESNLAKKPPREYQTIYPERGDVTFWTEWEGDFFQMKYMETIGVYYGVGRSWDMRGDVPLNVFAKIKPEQLDALLPVGVRIWRKGQEKVTLKKKG
jgi:hypothetical protein